MQSQTIIHALDALRAQLNRTNAKLTKGETQRALRAIRTLDQILLHKQPARSAPSS